MAIHVALNHRTYYTYDRFVGHSPHIVRLRPAPHCRTPILSYSLRVVPTKHFINWQQDPHANYQARLVFPEKARELLIEVDLVAEMSVFNPFDFFLEPAAEKCPFEYEPWLRRELTPFLEACPQGPKLRALIDHVRPNSVRTIDALVAINRHVQSAVKYLIRLEPGVRDPEETLTLGDGSCRDSAWLLVQVLRGLGLAARFVSGYLIQLTPDVKSLDGPSGATHDFTDLHAWTEVFLPGAGWIGLDPTSGLLAGEGHLPLACTPDPGSAAPVTGAVDECESKLEHTMRVTRIHESPRVTKPYTEEQWTQIRDLGHRIDAEIKEHDLRLTMGGEPTFVSVNDMDGPEWNFEATSPTKRKLGDQLLRRLKKSFAPGGLLFHGQGKWYPGESLPRWALGCYWRRDHLPVWRDESLIADEARNYGHGREEAGRFLNALVERLGVPERFIVPGYEDAWYHLWKERRLPANVDPLRSDLKDPEERKRLARILEQDLGQIVGFALPIRRGLDPKGALAWISGQWFLRTERMYLIPGDSPMGYRLPLDSLPWVIEGDYPWEYPPDPTVAMPPLPATYGQVWPVPSSSPTVPTLQKSPGSSSLTGHRAEAPWPAAPDTAPRPGQSAPWVIRTALCVEPRNGRLHVFIPPIASTEDYLELVAVIEDTASALRMPILIEGNPPPHDQRLNHIKVTPDPGVIEVNMHPAENWDDMVTMTTRLYEDARLTGLGAEKFMLDGRHTGTGGGNHIVVGGATPSDSPLLRRPDLLRSLVGYWNNHPSLSYLFSGLFLGPTSQHPRVDEARNDSVHELEIAFGLVNEGGASTPWQTDRLFRNLLVDVTGNTHRAEFCIDKMYSPDSSSGRLGLLELRAFEMPPHERMSLTQALLLRSLITKFWKKPYEQKLVRWGTQLHDRFLLPHFVWQDFEDVIEDLEIAEFPIKTEWFKPHFEFRFPLCGRVNYRGVEVELRQALEPWHVMGEQNAGTGTARYVDSSLERLQVHVRGLVDSRHLVACNGRAAPLHPTGVQGEYVAGIRFRAWQPPNCLHPSIGVHSPLVFDLVDTWNGRSIGGCTYHVMHPGGLSYETFPINAYEAESRRLSRFFPFGHTPGPLAVPPPEPNPEFPFTLDMRRH